MSVEIVGFDGVPTDLSCALHRAVWSDDKGLFVLAEGHGSARRTPVFRPDFENAISQGRATALTATVDSATPWVLVASGSFADRDGASIPMHSMTEDDRGFYWCADSKQSLREIAATWSASLLPVLSSKWRVDNDRSEPPVEVWLRHIARLRAAYSVTSSPKEARQCALYMLALGERIEEKKVAMQRAVARLAGGSLANDNTLTKEAVELAKRYGVAEKDRASTAKRALASPGTLPLLLN